MDQSGDAPAQSFWSRLSGKKERAPRPHPFADEVSPPSERDLDPKKVTTYWLGGATFLLLSGLLLSYRYSPYGRGGPSFIADPTSWLATVLSILPGVDIAPGASVYWDQWTLVPLFMGLTLLGFGFFKQTWSKRLTMAGWLLFGFYWGLTATDLYVKEDEDIVNFIFALFGVYFFAYLSYQNWLDLMRRSETHALHFLNVTAFIAAGTYFVIAKIQFLRVWLINVVGNHTKWMLDLFGQGDKAGIEFVVDKQDSQGPVTFFYPEYYCETGRGDMVSDVCMTAGPNGTAMDGIRTYFPPPENFLDSMLFYKAGPEGVVPVSIILACTAIQSIMLFVGLFAGTEADWRKKLRLSLIVGAIIYVLNLVRNTGIIWFYGQGHASFWTMHNAIGKGGSLLAMIGIAFGVFKFFPEFFKSLSSVLDLPDRDGPIEQTLKMGRRRPEPTAEKFAGEE